MKVINKGDELIISFPSPYGDQTIYHLKLDRGLNDISQYPLPVKEVLKHYVCDNDTNISIYLDSSESYNFVCLKNKMSNIIQEQQEVQQLEEQQQEQQEQKEEQQEECICLRMNKIIIDKQKINQDEYVSMKSSSKSVKRDEALKSLNEIIKNLNEQIEQYKENLKKINPNITEKELEFLTNFFTMPRKKMIEQLQIEKQKLEQELLDISEESLNKETEETTTEKNTTEQTESSEESKEVKKKKK